MPAKILVVDDEPDLELLIRQKFRKKIRRQELQFLFANNGIEALAKLETEPDIDVILTDINMPQMDGLTLLTRLAELNYPTLKTIVISAYGDLDRIRTAMNRGAFDFLTKPIDLQDLEITTYRTLDHVQQLKEAQAQKRLAEEAQAERLKNQTLRESEQRLTQFLDAVPIGVFVVDATGAPYYANPTAQEILGQSLRQLQNIEALTDVYQMYVLGSDRLYSQAKQPILRALQGESMTIEDAEIHRGDTVIPIEVSATPIFAETGEIIYAIAAFKDISQRQRQQAERREFTKALEIKTEQLAESNRTLEHKVMERTAQLAASMRQAEQAQAEAEAANQAKSAFLANMSHELRTPLNAILGFTQLMRYDSVLNPKHQEYLEIISHSGEHLLALINDVLEMSKIEAGRVTFNESSFDLFHLLDSLAEMLELKAIAKSLKLICQRHPDVPQYVRTDEGKLRQVLINLIGNAIKFTDNGYVRLEVGCIRDTNIPLSPNQVVILTFQVEDTGQGIATEEMDGLFVAFVQTESGRKAQSGTGLGLPISRQFVRLMGGEIRVESELTRGTTVAFEVQAVLADSREIIQPKISKRPTDLAPDQPDYRILVVEDKRDNRGLLVELFQKIGFSVREAANGREAVEIWTDWQPHLIWMDMRMPVMDGYQATQEIRRRERVQWGERSSWRQEEQVSFKNRTVIIALTAIAFEEERAVVLSAGCDEIVLKPFQEAVLFDKMSEHLGVRFIYNIDTPVVETSDSPTAATANPIQPDALASMPTSWLADLHKAAICADAELVLSLLKTLPDRQQALRLALIDLVDNFSFEEIARLTVFAVEE
ncbi:MAG: response regulator [Jaaginema sp. PMC 1079.18]|nr:response regulator [Jaaginema sp. PMC 1080.18]MEC4850634.1 response regulator [Jaaginema sp. PMC 1079.18]MEC4866304.1 response regulator [Jaaginema sp. PMC 1078.18]